MKYRVWIRGWAAALAVACALPAGASLEKLQAVRVPLLALLVEAFEVEGEAYNLSNEAGVEPAFHSARWNPEAGTMEWRFWVPADGMLAGKLRVLSRDDAIALLTRKMKDLAIVVGLEPMPGFEKPMGCLATANVQGRNLLSEAEWAAARKELAAVSVIHLAAPHADGAILLDRTPAGKVIEKVVKPAGAAGAKPPTR